MFGAAEIEPNTVLTVALPSPLLGGRLRSREVRFATFDSELLQSIKEGTAIALWPGKDAATSIGVQV